jgi:hypothetical protein
MEIPYDSISKGKKITAHLLNHTAGLSIGGFKSYAKEEKLQRQ